VAAIDVAAASGLGLLAERERDATAASSEGTGRLILAALASGARTIYIGAGGSATTDGGAGALDAVRAGGGLDGAELIVLCDVRTPYEDAARVFAPQKGATPREVTNLTKRLGASARRLPRDPRGRPMTGAAGGLAGGLWAELDAELVPGARCVLDAVDFDARMRAARVVVTGEGRLDQQSLAGKLVSEVATRARQSGVPCQAIVGSRALDAFGARVLDLEAVWEASSEAELERAGTELGRALG
jgi:glycerate kinase